MAYRSQGWLPLLFYDVDSGRVNQGEPKADRHLYDMPARAAIHMLLNCWYSSAFLGFGASSDFARELNCIRGLNPRLKMQAHFPDLDFSASTGLIVTGSSTPSLCFKLERLNLQSATQPSSYDKTPAPIVPFWEERVQSSMNYFSGVFRNFHFSPQTQTGCYNKASQKAHRTTIMKEVTMIQKLKTPSKLKNNDIVTQPIHRASNQMSNISGPEAPLGHRNTLTSRLVSSYPSPKTPVARHMRVLSRHIRSFEIPVDAQGTQANFSLTQIPSIMDVYLDAKSPSIDFTEEVLLEIAARSRRLSLISSPGFALASSTPQSLCPHWDVCDARHSVNSDSQSSFLTSEMTGLNPPWGQISLGKNAAQSGSLARHPDSFERSTATWSEGLNGK
ncbi:hypothetical protein F5878DRAFT_639334 [Lentinula raphanica]|uniref:Uncharacterized protein n=1 Tax=Lentinula raphanica TaxID=153919 RepID=A0AA38UHB5_9AGAR|nr:hypothetical protein F5880DRAFT_1504680 [Lentinula raphanica]KAJ3841797.1 hypothetical protein F5878DRAFT_639334 [Lentinula raphanica]